MTPRPDSAPALTLSPNAQARMDARAALLTAWKAYSAAAKAKQWQALEAFCSAYNAGQLELPEWVRAEVVTVSPASIWRWERAVEQEGVGRLAGRYGDHLRGRGLIDRQPELQQVVVGMMVKDPHCHPTHVLALLQARFREVATVEVPGLRTLERWMAGFQEQHREALLSLSHPDKWKGTYMAAFGDASEDVVQLNQRWEYDSTPADVMLEDGRHSILGVVDVASRRGKVLVSPTSKATAIGLLTRRVLLKWGVAKEAKTDNGQDYKSRHLTRVFVDLDIQQHFCPPFQPWHKPHIERYFRTMSHDLMELLTGFLGHNVAEQQKIRDRKSFAEQLFERNAVVEVKLTGEKLQSMLDRWNDDVYAHRPHEGLNGRTPWDVAAELQAAGVRRIENERALDILLAEAPRGPGRKVLRKGIQVEGAWFVADELGGCIGQEMQIRLDPADIGRIYVFRASDGSFVCIARALEREGISRVEVAAAAKARQQAKLKQQRAELRSTSRKAGLNDVVEEILADAGRRAARLATLPAPTTEHETTALSAAAEAARAMDELRTRQEQAPPVAVQAADLPSNVVGAAAIAQRRAEVAQVCRTECETPWDMARWCAEEEWFVRITAGDAAWLAEWRRENPEDAQRLANTIELRFGRRTVAAGI